MTEMYAQALCHSAVCWALKEEKFDFWTGGLLLYAFSALLSVQNEWLSIYLYTVYAAFGLFNTVIDYIYDEDDVDCPD